MDSLGYVGERVNKLVVYLAGVSRLLSKPLSIYIQAGSSSGKSYLIETVRKLLPPESVLAISSFSDQALNYMRKEDFTGKVMLLGRPFTTSLSRDRSGRCSPRASFRASWSSRIRRRASFLAVRCGTPCDWLL